MWQYQNTDELYHHGILGQRWGFRRYQNPDGTLTPAGRRRANKLASQYAKVTGKKLIVKKKSVIGNEKLKPKTISEMSDAELRAKINRIYLEQDYARAIASRQPKQRISKGRRFINTVKKEVIGPAMIAAGKKVLTNVLTKQGNKAVRSLSTNNDTTKKVKQQLVKNVEKAAAGEKATKKVYKKKVIKNDLGKITVDGIVYKQLDDIKNNNKKNNKK